MESNTIASLLESARIQIEANRYALLRKIRDQKIIKAAVKAK